MKPLILQAEDDQARGQIAVVSWKYPNPAALRDPFSSCRDVAQPGRALAWGARGRQFKSARPDQPTLRNPANSDNGALLLMRMLTNTPFCRTQEPLWPQAPYTQRDRNEAIERGLKFIGET